VHGGFVQVGNNKVSILSDQAELGEQIDRARATAARERAEEALRRDAQDTGRVVRTRPRHRPSQRRWRRALRRSLIRSQGTPQPVLGKLRSSGRMEFPEKGAGVDSGEHGGEPTRDERALAADLPPREADHDVAGREQFGVADAVALERVAVESVERPAVALDDDAVADEEVDLVPAQHGVELRCGKAMAHEECTHRLLEHTVGRLVVHRPSLEHGPEDRRP
jgi:hypothetical protein